MNSKFKFIFAFIIVFLTVLIGCQQPKQEKVVTVDEFGRPEWTKNATIYEVNIRQYTPEGTFKAFEKHLPKLKEMGADILWLMPIHPIGELNRKGSKGSYYSVKDYKAVNPEFGTDEDFRSLVNKIHEMGMYVIIDWVANHTSWDNIWTETNPEFFNRDSLGNFFPPVEDWSDVIDLNYENKDLWNSMNDALEYWVREFNIDGYRCDVAAMVPNEYWKQLRPKLDAIKPVFMLAEAHEPELHENGFDMTYNWQLKDVMNDIAKGAKDVSALDQHIKDEDSLYAQHDYRMTFTTNHDENSWNGTVFERLGEAVETFAVLTNMIEGMPLVYSGQEAGLDKALEFFEKDEIEWKEHRLREVYTTLFNLKEENKALWNGIHGGQLERINTNDDNSIFAFVREKDGNKIFAVFNFSPESKKVEINDSKIAGSYKQLFSENGLNVENEFSNELGAWEYKVFYK